MPQSKWFAPVMALPIAACIIAADSYIVAGKKKNDAILSKNMLYIKQNSPNKYVNILEKSIGLCEPEVYNLWAKNAESIRDSLRIDSIAKSNYAKGLQMAKDTIKVVK